MSNFSITSFLTKTFLKLFALWQFLFFFPIWFVVSRSNWGKTLIHKIIQSTNLNKDYQAVKHVIVSIKNWILGIIKAIFNKSSKSKYPFGYAILTKNGLYMTTLNQFPYLIQLYDYLSRKFMHIKNLSTFRVMEIEPTTEGGLEYLATALKATSCVGVTTDQYSFRSLKKSNINPRVKYIHSPKLDSVEIKQSNYDCIIGINVFEKSNILNQTLKLIKKSLKPTGYACLGEYLPVDQISVFEYCLKQAGLRIVKTQNISSGLSNAIKIQAKSQSKDCFSKKMKRMLNYVLQESNLQIDILVELQMRRKFIAYIVQSQSQTLSQ